MANTPVITLTTVTHYYKDKSSNKLTSLHSRKRSRKMAIEQGDQMCL
jgi:hypothetical protein